MSNIDSCLTLQQAWFTILLFPDCPRFCCYQMSVTIGDDKNEDAVKVHHFEFLRF